ADAGANREHQPEQADGGVCKHTRDDQAEAESQHHRPRGGSRQRYFCLQLVTFRLRFHHDSFPYLPRTYTTVKTTTQTASTKCQYSDSTSRRSALASVTLLRSANTRARASMTSPTTTCA